MKVTFKEKRLKEQLVIDDKTKQLFDFIMNNKEYLDMTIFILTIMDEECNEKDLEKFIEGIFLYDKIKENIEKTNEFKNILYKFYTLEESESKIIIDSRRGGFLELIMLEISPLKRYENSFDEKVRESLFLRENRKIDNKDIDLVCISKSVENDKASEKDIISVECIECKIVLESFLKKENLKNVGKISFMKNVKKCLMEDCNILSDLYFATLSKESGFEEVVLKSDFDAQEFKVFNGRDIKKYLNNNELSNPCQVSIKKCVDILS